MSSARLCASSWLRKMCVTPPSLRLALPLTPCTSPVPQSRRRQETDEDQAYARRYQQEAKEAMEAERKIAEMRRKQAQSHQQELRAQMKCVRGRGVAIRLCLQRLTTAAHRRPHSRRDHSTLMYYDEETSRRMLSTLDADPTLRAKVEAKLTFRATSPRAAASPV